MHNFELSKNVGPELTKVREATAAITALDSEKTFNAFARSAVAAFREEVTAPAPSLPGLLNEIARGENGKNVVRTDWGGVAIRIHERTTEAIHVEKFLAVKAGTWLAFEWHTKKKETLHVREGTGLLIYRKTAGAALELMLLQPGSEVYLPPEHEHCIIALGNLVVYEVSDEAPELGMDGDLQFVYMPNYAA